MNNGKHVLFYFFHYNQIIQLNNNIHRKLPMLPKSIQLMMNSFFVSQELNQYFRKQSSYQSMQHQFLKKQQFYSWKHSNGLNVRRLYYNANYHTQELLAIQQVKKLLIQQSIQNQKVNVKNDGYQQQNMLSDEVILKHIHAGNFNICQSFERLKLYKGIIQNLVGAQENCSRNKIVQNLAKGMIYTFGCTKQGFLIVILRIDLIDTTKPIQQNFSIFNHLLSTVLHYKLKPYHRQKYILFIDLNNQSFTQINYKYLHQFMFKVGILYCGFSDKIFVFNSKKIGILWSIVKGMLPDHIVKKVQFIVNQKQSTLFQIVDKNQLQQKYGGNLSNLSIFWPPQRVNSHEINKKTESNQLNFDDNQSQTQYYSFENNSSIYKSMTAAKTNRSYKSLGTKKKKIIQITLQQNVSQENIILEKQQTNCTMCSQHCNVCAIY